MRTVCSSRIQFGPFKADLRTEELLRGTERLKLTCQPFHVLMMLLERPGEVVTRAELRQRLWPSDTFVDFDHSLNTCVNRIRRVLGDSAKQPQFLETLPKRGYRLIIPVQPLDGSVTQIHHSSSGGSGHVAEASTPALSDSDEKCPSGELSGSDSMTAAAESHGLGGTRTGSGVLNQTGPLAAICSLSKGRRRSFTLAGLLIPAGILLLGLSETSWRRRSRQNDQPAPIQSLAVLPLVNLSADPSQEDLADGVTDTLISDLAKLGGLNVTSLTSGRYKMTQKPIAELAAELKVSALVKGSVTLHGDRVRVTARLIQTEPERQLWAAEYEHDLEEFRTAQTEIGHAIAEEIARRLARPHHSPCSEAVR
jgi:TolB-like protein/DNA-binding winged helix-turn-helix (wHTH) protein